jgi:hypothetical protein
LRGDQNLSKKSQLRRRDLFGRFACPSGKLRYFKIVNSVFGDETLYQKPTEQFTILESAQTSAASAFCDFSRGFDHPLPVKVLPPSDFVGRKRGELKKTKSPLPPAFYQI